MVTAHDEDDDEDEEERDADDEEQRRAENTTSRLHTAFDSRARYADIGERIDDFEDIDEWVATSGSLDAETGTTYEGSQSARLASTTDDGGNIEIRREFDDLDLSGRTLSVAIRLESPDVEQLDAIVEDESGDEVVMGRRTIESDYGWFILDLGVTEENGDPDLENVAEIRIQLNQDNGRPISLLLDDLRATERGDGGYVLLTFDDTPESQYEKAFPVMRRYGFPGFAAINPDRVGDEESLSLAQLEDLQDAGWEIGSHTMDHRNLPELETSEAREQVATAKEWLLDNGFETGADSFVYPWSSSDPLTRDVVSDYHYLAFTDGSNTHGQQLRGPLTVGRIFAEERERVADALSLAAKYDQVVVLAYHEIGAGKWIDEAGFRDQMQLIAATEDLEVVTPSALLEDVLTPPLL
ncbi:polysaccharide deacetylase family protein [Haloarcula nitratireducens]|uniref:Polysaccharide deacetylase family protein n=1 Tax=Haloarcula nitratireducens TaxID=2487749 RepID=A0AAW4PEU2_9EURY|nr:polysaccharide deacetylase family protein [Halomicroarcula nitratireducens]MBX0296126.1 polysaccharide deacetylase family protein [Halomicroarcula nitratireducens]